MKVLVLLQVACCVIFNWTGTAGQKMGWILTHIKTLGSLKKKVVGLLWYQTIKIKWNTRESTDVMPQTSLELQYQRKQNSLCLVSHCTHKYPVSHIIFAAYHETDSITSVVLVLRISSDPFQEICIFHVSPWAHLAWCCSTCFFSLDHFLLAVSIVGYLSYNLVRKWLNLNAVY